MDFPVIRELYHCTETCGFREEDIQEAITRFGALPSVLINYYRQLGDNDEINQIADYLCSSAGLELKDGYLFFYVTEQKAIWWAIRETDLQKDNPPVYAYFWKNSKYTYFLESETLEQFLNAMAYSHAIYSFPLNSEGDFECNEERKKRIEAYYQKKPFGFLATPLILFYGNDPDEVIRICIAEDCMQVAYACTTQEQFDTIEKVIFNRE